MVSEGKVLDFQTRHNLVHALCASGNLDEAGTVLRAVVQTLARTAAEDENAQVDTVDYR